MADVTPEPDQDDTDMTNDEFERAFAAGQPVQIVTSRAEFEASAAIVIVSSSSNGGAHAVPIQIGGLNVELGRSLVDAGR
jgi:hypothetical protein